MVNRVENWWKDVQIWKERISQIIGAGNSGDRLIKREELRMLDSILSRRVSNLTKEERESRRKMQFERRLLERQVYPNSIMRLLRNLGKLSLNTALLPFKVLNRVYANQVQNRQIERSSQKLGVNDLIPDIKKKVNSGLERFSEEYSESIVPGELVHYKIHHEQGTFGKIRVSGMDASMTKSNAAKVSVELKETEGLMKDHLRELLHGRSINIKNGKWLIPDLSDRDANGNIRIKEVMVGNLDLEAILSKFPNLSPKSVSAVDLVDSLKNGKRVDVLFHINGEDVKANLQANPLHHTVDIYRNGKKMSLASLETSLKVMPKKAQVKELKPENAVLSGKRKMKL